MDTQMITEYLNQYGTVVIFIIIFLEHINLPGLPAGVVMPLSGVWAANSSISFWEIFILSVLGGVLGSLVLYYAGMLGGSALLNFIGRKFPKSKMRIDKYLNVLQKKGAYGVFGCRLIPVVRTLISIPAGLAPIHIGKYVISTAAGVILWNFAFIGAGYVMGEQVWSIF